jgi:hypothetical protein
MPREIDPKRTRKALRAVQKLKTSATESAEPAPMSAWETKFLEEVEQRLDTFGSAFADLRKGDADEALSRLQTIKLKEIARKQRKATREALKSATKTSAGDGPRGSE